MKLGIIATMEDLREDQAIDPAEGMLAAEEVNDGISEASMAEVENDNIDTAIGDGISGVESIDEMKDTVQEIVDSGDGSVSPMVEETVSETLESIMTSLGITHTVSSMESVALNNRGKGLIATLEDSKTGIINTLKKAFKAAMEALMNFIANLLRNNWALEKYLKFVRGKAMKVTGTPSKQMMSESASALSFNGRADMGSIEEMYKTAGVELELSNDAIEVVNKLNFKFGEVDEPDVNQFMAKFGKLPAGYKGGLGALTGGRSYSKTSEVFIVSSPYGEMISNGDAAKEIAVASTKDMNAILGKAEDIIAGLKKFDSKRSAIKNITSRVLQYLAQDFSQTAGVVSDKAKEFSSELGKIRGIRGFMNKIIGKMPLEAFKTAKALIDYVRHSMKYYSGAENTPNDKGVDEVESDFYERKNPKKSAEARRKENNSTVIDV